MLLSILLIGTSERGNSIMGFDVTLLKNNSEVNAVTKSLTTVTTLSGTLKEDCSIIDPVILLDYDLSALPQVNYCHIPIWGRYYFINNIVSVRAALCEIHCHVDVLYSFRSQILANEAIIHRQENNWNLYINDGLFHVYQNPDIQIKNFPQGFSAPRRIVVIAG